MNVTTVVVASRRYAPVAFALLVIAAVMIVLGSTYFGDASSPYDMCAAPDGRSLPCSLVRQMTR
jgi:hypothetical protein